MTGALTLVRPELRGPSGGTAYDERVLREWSASGRHTRDVRLPGSWPLPTDADRAALASALADLGPGAAVVVDGLVGSCCPTELADAAARGVRVTLLVHLPLDAELGRPASVRRQLHTAEQAALDAAASIVVPSQHAADDLARRYRLRRPAVVAIPGQDAAPPAVGSVPPQLLMLGALSPTKNQRVVLDALAGLTERPWRLVVAGPDRGTGATLRAQVQGWRTRAFFPGAVGGALRESLWFATDLVCVPSLAESYGLVVTEALARGIPAFVSRGTGAAEALAGRPLRPDADEPTDLPGRLLDPTDRGAWASALGQWLDDPALRADLAARAADRRDHLIPWRVTAARVAEAASGRP